MREKALGNKHSENVKKAMSENQRGDNNFLGKTPLRTEETKIFFLEKLH